MFLLLLMLECFGKLVTLEFTYIKIEPAQQRLVFMFRSSRPLLLLIAIAAVSLSCCSRIVMIGSAVEKTLARIANKQLIHSAGYINGKWSQAVHDKGTFDVYNPANGNLILQLPKMVHIRIDNSNCAYCK